MIGQAISPMRTGVMRPRRSETRPIAGAVNASIAAAQKNAAPTPTPEAPRSLRRSGISTSNAPDSTDGMTTSQKANITGALSIAATTARTLGIPPAGIPGAGATHAARTPATTATPQKTTLGPVTEAMLPTTGPSRIPKIAAASAAPIISPRRSAGVAAKSQPSAPVQAQAPPRPSAKRAMSRTTTFSANAKTTLATPSRLRPARIVGLKPIRAARNPDGRAATRVPAA